MKKFAVALLVCCALLKANAEQLTWLTSVPQAQSWAKAQNKLVLMDFTGSDWCIWCKRLDNDTFSKPEFADYAKKNLILVQLDYPEKTPLAPALKAANTALATRYKIEGYPTIIAMKPDGTVIWRVDGYLEGGPKAMIAQIEKARQK